ncbi:MAG: hypothetical protein ACFCU8_20560 [Thermosynechococcaceae cyanobacterium]
MAELHPTQDCKNFDFTVDGTSYLGTACRNSGAGQKALDVKANGFSATYKNKGKCKKALQAKPQQASKQASREICDNIFDLF